MACASKEGPGGLSTPRARRLAWMLLLLALASCRTARTHPGRGTRTPEAAQPTAAPAWRYQPHSWERLNAIVDWLQGPGPAAWPELVAQAELDLAEGRLRFAREEASTLPGAGLELRLQGAEKGFRKVLADASSTPLQRSRAQSGLVSVEELRDPSRSTPHSLSIRSRASWGAKPPVPARMTRHLGAYTRITVHHSAKHTRELGRKSEREIADTLRRIQLVHMRDSRWGDIGYHFLIDPRGNVLAGRSLLYQGAHAGGANNVGNLGICMLGNFELEAPTPQALATLEELVDALAARHRIPPSRIFGHKEFKPTECPGRRLMSWVQRYRGGVTASR